MKDNLPIPDEYEINLLKNADVYFKIQSLENKVSELFGIIARFLEPIIQTFNSNLKEEFQSKNAKISRGNNYKGLPWTILDYPRNIDKTGVFAIRLICLRGNTFIITLHLSGKFYHQYKTSIFENLQLLKENQYLITNGKSEWEHLITDENYIEIQSNKKLISETINKIELNQYIKFAKAIPFDQWENLDIIIEKEYKLLLSTLK